MEEAMNAAPLSTRRTVRLEALVYVREGCIVHVLPESGTWHVGRDPDNDIRIVDQSVSRHHLALHFGAGVAIEDLNSANGTLLFPVDPKSAGGEYTHRSQAEQRLQGGERRAIAAGDLIRLGIALIVIQEHRPTATQAVRRTPQIAPTRVGPAVLLDPEVMRVYEVALRAARSTVSVLISGETGCGKEVFADTIHQCSNRSGRAFLRLNCAALSPSLLESELFGYERGAFTGANQAKAGLLEATDQGSVFLDEIGEMPLSMQAKLLRVLEERSVLRIGATKPRPIDLRFIWATNRDLRAEARAGRFRQDLFYRIAGVEFAIPPLRRRRIEIEPLARLFLDSACKSLGQPVPELTSDALSALLAYSWPGNVRELKNVMERAPFIADGGPITSLHVPCDEPETGVLQLTTDEEEEKTQVFMRPKGQLAASSPPRSEPPPSHARRSWLPALGPSVARRTILEALERCAGNQTRAAKVLGVSRRTLINHLERLGVPRPKIG
jgi:two-component system, NtrC family, response regulator AtoC